MNIYESLQKIREEQKISRKDMEKFSGFAINSIANYEKGRRPISDKYRKVSSLVFGLSDDFFFEEDIADLNDYKYSLFSRALGRYQLLTNMTDTALAKLLNVFIETLDFLKKFKGKSSFQIEDFMEYLRYIEVLHVKPSAFGVNKEFIDGITKNKTSYKQWFVCEAQYVTVHQITTINEKVAELEKKGYELDFELSDKLLFRNLNRIGKPQLNINEVEKALHHTWDVFKEEDQKLLELWHNAPIEVQDKIIATLEKYKQIADEVDDI